MPDTTDLKPLPMLEIEKRFGELEGWDLSLDHKEIYKEYRFKNYYKTINFVNVLAWVAQDEKHHPDLEVNYGRVFVKFTTHDADGLTEKDFTCAQRIDQFCNL